MPNVAFVYGYNLKTKKGFKYPDQPSAIRLVLYGPDRSVKSPPQTLKCTFFPSKSKTQDICREECYQLENILMPQQFTQAELDDLARDPLITDNEKEPRF
ncbi:hypothetical protein FQA39_LY04493 [Lamprigera yunnana]|nr:hypothetical protein FQA39_LY04493 [Lamprigera yunnana]